MWLVVVIPIATVILAALAASAAYYPQWKDRKAREEKRQEQERRLAETADAVLGRDANQDYHGQPEVVGLVKLFAGLQKEVAHISRTLGTNRNGKTVVDHVAENTASIRRLGDGQAVLSEHLDRHEEQDSARFDRLDRTVGGIQTGLASVERAVRKPKPE